jgi:secreted Zn-dependent insulinase-like peptidase
MITLDFNFNKIHHDEDLVHLKLLESIIKRRLKSIFSKLKLLKNKVTVSSSNDGIKLIVDVFTIISKETVKEIVEKALQENRILEESRFDRIKEELLQKFRSQMQSQPIEKAFELARKALIKKFLTNEEYFDVFFNKF